MPSKIISLSWTQTQTHIPWRRGGGDGRGGQGGQDGDHHGGQFVLGGQGDDVGATETYQAGRRDEGV